MNMAGAFGVLLSLGLVLGLLGLGLRALRRLTGVPASPAGNVAMRVLQRIALGPRQGLALVRIGERTLVVAVGDGGVRLITELNDVQRAGNGHSGGNGHSDGSVAAPVAASPTRASGGARLIRTIERFRVALFVALFALVAGAATAAGQTAGTTATPAAAPAAVAGGDAALGVAAGVAASQLTGEAGPRMMLQVGDGSDTDLRISGTVGTVLFLGLLAMLPTLLLLMTSFTRVIIVLHFLRQALGTQNTPPAHLLAALALLLTGFIMAPTLSEVNRTAIQPWMSGAIDEAGMLEAGVVPFRTFMLSQTTDEELGRFAEMSGQPIPETAEELSLPVLVSAFATNELRAAFQMGFALFLPFIVIDLVVSAVLTSMGMFMLPPTMIALPCKLLLFVLVDGWSLIVGSIVSSFA